MSKRKFAYLLLVVMTSNSYAGPKSIDCDEVTEVERKAADLVRVAARSRECPSMDGLSQICSIVEAQDPEKDSNTGNTYAYQTYIQQAACADPKRDSEEEVKKKIRGLWNKFKDELICDVPSFTAPKGNLIKYAIQRRFEDFIDDVIDWGVDLNRIDPLDKRTVLDYVDYELERKKGSAVESELKRYKENLRKAGAKYAREL